MWQNPVKKALKEGKASVGTWLSLGNVAAARFMARTGFDWLNVDIEHSMVGIENTVNIFATCADIGFPCFARVPSNRHDHIKRVLDNGAHGVVVPMVNSREEAVSAVAAMHYPPLGNRSVGGGVHALNFHTTATEYYAKVNQELLVVLQCEHILAVENADNIFSVPGIDAIFVGPNDLAASMRTKEGTLPAPKAFEEALQHILKSCQKNKVAPGIHCGTAEEARRRIDEGWQFIAIASELKMMLDGAKSTLTQLGSQRAKSDLARY
ncbi:2-dehydro-3-deoxyglucarate aldolase [Telmatocola sphagniphila]|uniref:2-dehydro-3-deoxyglucarate aldolase n=1 Tax=Telmatocola sphagniphila TaxID=1123043 RepID=A0A8E6B2A8_9BACT|nr:aldolase/citrate lyase family protein [Telmatocola sphagniphila]QVL30522.1 2-dehydro-3-deoxyglucarate aldolase [Telmatocola sphagniphila]